MHYQIQELIMSDRTLQGVGTKVNQKACGAWLPLYMWSQQSMKWAVVRRAGTSAAGTWDRWFQKSRGCIQKERDPTDVLILNLPKLSETNTISTLGDFGWMAISRIHFKFLLILLQWNGVLRNRFLSGNNCIFRINIPGTKNLFSTFVLPLLSPRLQLYQNFFTWYLQNTVLPES